MADSSRNEDTTIATHRPHQESKAITARVGYRVALMSQRLEKGLDLFTGRKLTPQEIAEARKFTQAPKGLGHG